MYAKRVHENVLAPKSKTEILSSLMAWDDYWSDILEILNKKYRAIPKGTFTEDNYDELRESVFKFLKNVGEYFTDTDLMEIIEDWEYQKVYESIGDTLKPKDSSDIRQELDNIGDEIILRNGKSVWLIQQTYPGMAGEDMEILTIVDENGEAWPLNNETLDALDFDWDDRKELVELMNQSYLTNNNNAIAYVK